MLLLLLRARTSACRTAPPKPKGTACSTRRAGCALAKREAGLLRFCRLPKDGLPLAAKCCWARLLLHSCKGMEVLLLPTSPHARAGVL